MYIIYAIAQNFATQKGEIVVLNSAELTDKLRYYQRVLIQNLVVHKEIKYNLYFIVNCLYDKF